MTSLEELFQLVEPLSTAASGGKRENVSKPISALRKAVAEFGRSFSGSWLGYHSWVDFENSQTPPVNFQHEEYAIRRPLVNKSMYIDDKHTSGQYVCSIAKLSSTPSMPCLGRKIEVASTDLTPGVRCASDAAAEFERRSMSNVFEVSIFHYVKLHHTALSSATATLDEGDISSKD